MHRIASYIVIASMTIGVAAAAPLTGWISDSTCGAANASGQQAARDCAARCIKEGASPVFVSDGDNKVYKITGTAKVTEHLQHKVRVTGDVKGDTITIKEIKKAD